VGLFSKLFGNKEERLVDSYFQALTAYVPVFTTFEGGLYEMELTRAVIHSFANSVSKLKPQVSGTAKKSLEKTLLFRPNPYQNTSQFLYRIATMFKVNNNAFVVPIHDEFGHIGGYFPILPITAEIIERGGVPYLRYTFANGKRAAIEFSKVGMLTQFQFEDDFFGSDNSPMKSTIKLIHTTNEGIENATKNSAFIRFIGKITAAIKDKDVKEARDTFASDNLSVNNQSGMMVYDGKFADVKQIINKPYTVDAAQMKLIKDNVFNYFGTNEKILQNSYTEEEWNAYYEGVIAPFALQLSLAITYMTYTKHEIAHGNRIDFTTNRLQHVSNNTKIQISTQLVDRGVVVPNEARELLGLPPIEGGDTRIIRRDYVEADLMDLRDLEIKDNLGIKNNAVTGGDDDSDNEGEE